MLAWMQDISIKAGDIVVVGIVCLRYASLDEHIYEKIKTPECHTYLCAKIYEYCKQNGADCYFLLFPTIGHLKQHTLAEKTWFETLKESTNQTTITPDFNDLVFWGQKFLDGKIFNLTSIVEANHLKTNFFIDDCHYSPEGNRIIAEELYSILFDKYDSKTETADFSELDAYFSKNRIYRKYPFIWDLEWLSY